MCFSKSELGSGIAKGRGGKGADIGAIQNLSSTEEFQVGVPRTFTAVSPLSPWERARVRGF
jgi:hypothetical protein